MVSVEEISAVCRRIFFCRVFWRFAAEAAVVLMCCVAVSCGGRDDGDGRSPAEDAALKALEDSFSVNSPHTLGMIRRGMAEADDSMEYYDYYLRLIRYDILHNEPDTAPPDWDRMRAFLASKRRTPRVRGMLAFLANVRGSYNHKYHYAPYETISLYTEAYRGLFGSDSEGRLPDVCANLGDAYVAVNDMPRAAAWYRRALFLADSLGIPAKDNVSLYMGLGRIYLNIGDFDAALGCYRTSERSFGQMSLNMKIFFLNNYGNYYYYAKDYRSALAVFGRLRDLLHRYGMDEAYDMYLCRINMADVCLNLGMAEEARRNLGGAEAFFRRIGDETGMYYSRTIRIGLALRDGGVARVRKLLAEERMSTTVDFNLKNIRDGYLRDYYVRTGDYRKAYGNLCENIAHNDSLKHNIANMRAAEIMMRYAQDTLQLHNQIAMQEKDADIRKARWGLYTGVLLACVLALLLLCLFTYARKRRLQMQVQLTRLKLMSARSRISPHFIFNVLNTRISKAGRDDADELMGLVRLIRANLNMSGRSYVSLKEELDFVAYYISVQRACICDDLCYEVSAPPEDVLQGIMVPSMFIQILVENSIKHGLKARKGRRLLRVCVTEDGKSCRITVTDNGTGFDIRHRSPDSTGTGLKVIRSTINMINHDSKRKIRLGIRNLKDGGGGIAGCEITLDLPLGLKDTDDTGS